MAQQQWQLNAEDWGRVEQMVADLHAMHHNGGCANVKVLKSSLTWLRVMFFAVCGGFCGWMGYLQVKLDNISDLVAKLAK